MLVPFGLLMLKRISIVLSVSKCLGSLKIITGEWNIVYHDGLVRLSLDTLEKRRLDLSLCLLYKYVHSMCFFPANFISRKRNSGYNLRSPHPLQLEQPFARTNSHLFSFIPRSVSIWNSLPSSIGSGVFSKLV